jgi:hypothetical protein
VGWPEHVSLATVTAIFIASAEKPHLCGMTVAALGHMTMDLKVLKCGNCEPLKLGVHGMALGLAALCGLYNAAAWLSRREQHLAINTVLYTALFAFEQRHVAHHIAELRRPEATPELPDVLTVAEVAPVVAVAVMAAADIAA